MPEVTLRKRLPGDGAAVPLAEDSPGVVELTQLAVQRAIRPRAPLD